MVSKSAVSLGPDRAPKLVQKRPVVDHWMRAGHYRTSWRLPDLEEAPVWGSGAPMGWGGQLAHKILRLFSQPFSIRDLKRRGEPILTSRVGKRTRPQIPRSPQRSLKSAARSPEGGVQFDFSGTLGRDFGMTVRVRVAGWVVVAAFAAAPSLAIAAMGCGSSCCPPAPCHVDVDRCEMLPVAMSCCDQAATAVPNAAKRCTEAPSLHATLATRSTSLAAPRARPLSWVNHPKRFVSPLRLSVVLII